MKLRQLFAVAAACLSGLVAGAVYHVLAQSEGKQLAVFSPQATYSVPLSEVGGQQYLGVVELLEPLGSLEARRDGKKYKVQFAPPGGQRQELQFQQGKDKVKLHGGDLKLTASFIFQGERGHIPLSSASALLQRLLSTQAVLHQSSLRLFVGNVEVRYSLDLRKGTPSRLLVGFASAVNPTIATEPGHLRLTFQRSAVVSVGNDTVKYDDPLITGAYFSEHDGVAQLDITGTAPLLASFADGGRTIIVTGAPPPVAVTTPPQLTQPTQTLPPPTLAPPTPPPPRFLVLIDPAHGGTESGSAIAPTLPEKDVTLALARRVQHQLASKGIPAWLLRNSDVAIPLDQRAVYINADRPAVYVSIHAANTGKGVRVFTSLLPVADFGRGGFLPWNDAQAAFLDLSGMIAGSVAAELETRKLPNATLVAPLRPMNSIAAPAIAVELAPQDADVNSIAQAAYQDQVAQSIAAGIAAVRSKLPEVNR